MADKTPKGPAGGIPPETPLRPEDFIGAPSVPHAGGPAGAADPIIPPKKPMRPEEFIADPTPIVKLTAVTQNLVDNQEVESEEETKIQQKLRMAQEKTDNKKFAGTLNISVKELKIRRKALKEIEKQTKGLEELSKKIEDTGADPKANEVYMAKDLELTNATNALAQKALSGNALMSSQLETMKDGIDELGKKIKSRGGDPKKNEEYQRLTIAHQAKTNELLEQTDPSSRDSNTLEAMRVQLEQNGQVATDSVEYNKLNYKIQMKALEDRKEKADSPAARKEIRKEQAALAAKQEGLLGKIAGGMAWMKNNAKEKLKTVGKGAMAMLKGTLIAGALVALVAFLDSKYWKELKKWLVENGAPMLEGIFNTLKWVFGGIADIFSGKAFTDFAEKIKKGEILGAFGGLFSAFGALAVALVGIVAFLAPGLLFKGLWKGLKLLKKSLFGAGKAATAQAAAMKVTTAKATKAAEKTAKAAEKTAKAAEKTAKAAREASAKTAKAAEKTAKAAKIAAASRKTAEAATKKAAAAALKATKEATAKATKEATAKATKAAAQLTKKQAIEKTAKAAEKTTKKAAEKTAKLAKAAGKTSEKAASTAAKATKAVGKTAEAVAKGAGPAAKGVKGAGGALSKVGKGFAHLKKYPLLMKAAKKIPLLGPILSTVGVVSLLMGDASKEDKIKGIGGLIGGGLGSWGFGVVGATLGSLFPGPGTLIGGLLGSLVGWFGGEWAGEKLARFLMGEEESEKALLQNQKAPTSKSTAKSKEPPKQPPEKKLSKFETRRKKRQERTRAGKETRSKSQLKNMEEELKQSELFIKTGGKEGKDTVYNIGDDVKGEKEDLANKKAAIAKKKAEVAELVSKSPAALAAAAKSKAEEEAAKQRGADMLRKHKEKGERGTLAKELLSAREDQGGLELAQQLEEADIREKKAAFDEEWGMKKGKWETVGKKEGWQEAAAKSGFYMKAHTTGQMKGEVSEIRIGKLIREGKASKASARGRRNVQRAKIKLERNIIGTKKETGKIRWAVQAKFLLERGLIKPEWVGLKKTDVTEDGTRTKTLRMSIGGPGTIGAGMIDKLYQANMGKIKEKLFGKVEADAAEADIIGEDAPPPMPITPASADATSADIIGEDAPPPMPITPAMAATAKAITSPAAAMASPATKAIKSPVVAKGRKAREAKGRKMAAMFGRDYDEDMKTRKGKRLYESARAGQSWAGGGSANAMLWALKKHSKKTGQALGWEEGGMKIGTSDTGEIDLGYGPHLQKIHQNFMKLMDAAKKKPETKTAKSPAGALMAKKDDHNHPVSKLDAIERTRVLYGEDGPLDFKEWEKIEGGRADLMGLDDELDAHAEYKMGYKSNKKKYASLLAAKPTAVPKAAGAARALDRQRETKKASWRGRAGLVGINENRVETMKESKLDKAVPAAAPPVIINNNQTSVDNSQKTQATTLIGASTKNGNTAGSLAALRNF